MTQYEYDAKSRAGPARRVRLSVPCVGNVPSSRAVHLRASINECRVKRDVRTTNRCVASVRCHSFNDKRAEPKHDLPLA